MKSLDKGVCGSPAVGGVVDGGVKPVAGEVGSDEPAVAGENDPRPPVLGMPPPDPIPDEGMLMPPPPIGMVAPPLAGENVEGTWLAAPLGDCTEPNGSDCSVRVGSWLPR